MNDETKNVNTKILICFATLIFAVTSYATEKATAQKKVGMPPKKAISRSPANHCLCANDLSDTEKAMIELASDEIASPQGVGTTSKGLQDRMQDSAADFTVVSGSTETTLQFVKKNIELLDQEELDILRRVLIKKKVR
ncbi:MAG: hypothetical protein JNL01_06210 [Bdellovibrionales bacterium]|nr:hypothetical protein [Bdellovibrionales bacterium]